MSLAKSAPQLLALLTLSLVTFSAPDAQACEPTPGDSAAKDFGSLVDVPNFGEPSYPDLSNQSGSSAGDLGYFVFSHMSSAMNNLWNVTQFGGTGFLNVSPYTSTDILNQQCVGMYGGNVYSIC